MDWPRFDGDEIECSGFNHLTADIMVDIMDYADEHDIDMTWLLTGLDDAPIVLWAQDILDLIHTYGWYDKSMIMLTTPSHIYCL